MCSRQEDGTWENGKLLVCPDNGVCYSFALFGTVGNASGLDLRFKGCGPASSEIGCIDYTIPELANASVPMCTCNTFGCNAFDDCSYCKTKCYDCGNDDQCANEEDNGQLKACSTGSMCYHVSGSSELVDDEKYTLRGCMIPPTKNSGCQDTKIYGDTKKVCFCDKEGCNQDQKCEEIFKDQDCGSTSITMSFLILATISIFQLFFH